MADEEQAKKIEELNAEVARLKARIGGLVSVIQEVEWVFNNHEETECAWCGGPETGEKPKRSWYSNYWTYQRDLEYWRFRGHKPDCRRQAVLREVERNS